jgi:N6-adenosine-specific RNA methylase IME4
VTAPAHPELAEAFASLPRRDYRLVLMDPPWAFRTFAGKDRTPTQKNFREAEDHYPTMSLAAMQALPVADIMAKDSCIAMWVVGSHCDAALALAEAWGCRFVTDLFYWAKQKLVDADQIDLFTGDIAPPRISMGYYTRKQIEPCWLFKRGKGLPVRSHDVRQLILAPTREHSRKPPEQYDRLEDLFGPLTGEDGTARRVELFSRTKRPGWDSWGNEVGKFEEEAAA